MISTPVSDRFRFRLFTADDLIDLRELHGNAELMRFMHASGLPLTDAELLTWVETWRWEYDRAGYTKWRVETIDGQFLGRAGSSPIPDGQAELGYSLVKSQWGKGYATELASIVRDWAFANTDLPYLLGITMIGNTASQHVLAKIGMIPLGQHEFRGAPHEFFRLDRPSPPHATTR